VAAVNAHHAMALTPRDHSLLDTLTRRVRVLSLVQIGNTWYLPSPRSVSLARRRLGRLELAGYVEKFRMFARPVIPLVRPVLAWHPGLPEPDYRSLSRQLIRRWTQPAVPTTMVIASRQAGILLGGHGGRRPRASEATHDVCMAGLYLTMVERDPSIRTYWQSEARLRQLGYGDSVFLPDAMIVTGESRRVIEFGGSYSHGKVARFHQSCADEALPYEIW
jgi:hypothetical protein